MSTEEVAKKVVELTRKQAWYEALDMLYHDDIVSVEAFSMGGSSQIVSVSVINASPATFKLSIERLAASSLPAPHASVTSTGMYPRSAPWRAVGSIPISVAMPTTIKALMPQSRKAKSSQVPSKADIVNLSNTPSEGSGDNSGT